MILYFKILFLKVFRIFPYNILIKNISVTLVYLKEKYTDK